MVMSRMEPMTQLRMGESAVTTARPSANQPKVRAKDVSVFYGEKQALFDVSLEMPEKTVTALIGPSGCGKSTFLRSINRMNDTIEGARVTGEIEIDGEDINDKSVDPVLLRARVGDMASQVDVILANLEDAIPADAKEAARAGAIEMGKSFDFAKAGVGYWSRINALNSPWHLDDVTELVRRLELTDELDIRGRTRQVAGVLAVLMGAARERDVAGDRLARRRARSR